MRVRGLGFRVWSREVFFFSLPLSLASLSDFVPYLYWVGHPKTVVALATPFHAQVRICCGDASFSLSLASLSDFVP